MKHALILCGAVLLIAVAPAHARQKAITLDDIRRAVDEHWSGVRDIAVSDRATHVRYDRFGFIPVPRTNEMANAERPNIWMLAPGLEYLELWQGGRYTIVAFDGDVTRWQGRRNAFEDVRGRIQRGHAVPVDDLSFAYYVGRFSRGITLPDFLAQPDTRLVKDDTHVGEIATHRVAGRCRINVDGETRLYDVTLDLAPDYGWLPARTRLVDAETGLMAREYRVESFYKPGGFPFPKEAKIDLYQPAVSQRPGARPKARLTGSIEYVVDRVQVNGNLPPSRFAFDFSPGIEVSDEIAGTVYRTPESVQ